MKLLRRLKALFTREKPEEYWRHEWKLTPLAMGKWNENGEMVWTPVDGSPPYVIQHTGEVEVVSFDESLTVSKK